MSADTPRGSAGPPPPRRRHAVAQMTAGEHRVAELAALGQSNQRIAAELSVSVRTVESHLQRVYEKLGIHSRRELMLRWSGLALGALAEDQPKDR